MAEKRETEVSDSLQNITCPLCLDIFDDPTILTICGHTFCRKCLKKYDSSHQDLDHMVCPLCRKITKLTANRVDDLDTDVTVNGLVDDYHVSCGGANAILEKRQLCTACSLQDVAVSFCRTCNAFMCDTCHDCHTKQFTLLFKDHEIISIQDIMEGKVNIGRYSEKCSIHTQENKDMFCEDCKVHSCLKCVIIGHRDHKIKSQEDFEKELQMKVHDIIQQCTSKKSELEKNIQNVEAQRREVHTAVQKLRADVSQAYRTKAKQLEENQRVVVEQIDALERSFNEDLNTLKSNDRQRIKSICSSMTLVANDRLGRLEMDSLSAHKLLCEELDGMLKEATDHTYAAVITEKAQKKRFQPAGDNLIVLGNISDKLDPVLEVIKCVDLRGQMRGMTKYSDSSVGIGYLNTKGIDIIDSNGKKQQYANVSSNACCYGLVFQRDRTLCISTGSTEAHVYSPRGTRKSTIHVTSNGGYWLTLNRSPSDEILIANNAKHVYIYDPTGTTLKHTIPTKHNITSQTSATTSGLIVTSSCYLNPRIVAVYDRDGNAGKPLQAPSDIYLYATVDEQDRAYVASVDRKSGKVVIRLYDIDGLNLKERVEFNALNLTLGCYWCYLVSLSPDMLAFSCYEKLYFIKVVL